MRAYDLANFAFGLEITQADTAVGHGGDMDLFGHALRRLFFEILHHDLLVV